VLRIAEYLNSQIETLRANSPARNIIDLSVMAAFRAAGDFFEAREELEEIKKSVESRAADLTSLIDRKL
ncbi:MAG: cell division protein ZapA, partial [Thermodesulfobacteriota bacterium]